MRPGRPATYERSPRSPLYLSRPQRRRVQNIVRGLWNLLGSQKAVGDQLGVSQQAIAAVLSGHVTLGFAAVLSMHKRMLVADLIGPRRARAA